MIEGFKETFKPLIESQDKVKESVDKKQDAMIKQLQANQLAIIDNLNKHRLAITEGFNKMDEVKRWDLNQLPGFRPQEFDGVLPPPLPRTEEEEEFYDASPSTPTEQIVTESRPKQSFTCYNIEAKFNNDDREVLNYLGYPRPNDFFETNTGTPREINDEVKNEVKSMTGQIAGLKTRKQKPKEEKQTIELLQMQKMC